MSCGNILSRENPRWTCPECTRIVKALPPAMSNKYRKLRGPAKIPKKCWRGKSKGKKSLPNSSESLARTLEMTGFLKDQKFHLSECGRILSSDRANLLEVSVDLRPETRLNSKSQMTLAVLTKIVPKEDLVIAHEPQSKEEAEGEANETIQESPKSKANTCAEVVAQIEKNTKRKKKRKQLRSKKADKNQDKSIKKASAKKRKVLDEKRAPQIVAVTKPSISKNENDRPITNGAIAARKVSTPIGNPGHGSEDKRSKRKRLQELDPKQKSILQFFSSCAVTPVSRRPSEADES